MLDYWTIDALGSLLGFLGGAAADAVGWTWEKVVQGFYTWLANGLALMLEWVWSILDSATTPRLTEDWFRNELAARIGLIALAVVIAMMLASAIQAALAGRPEQIGDLVKEGVRAIVATALTVTVIDVLIGVTDEAADLVWEVGRDDLVTIIERIVFVSVGSPYLAVNVIGPACLMLGLLALLGLSISLLMRSALIYVAAAIAPLVWAANILPLFRGSARKLVHLLVALVLSKLAIVITLVCAVKLIANPISGTTDEPVLNEGAAAVGTLLTGFICFLVAAVSPLVLYRLMPTIEGAAVGAGVAGGWVRGASTAAHTAIAVKSLGASRGASAATRAVPGQRGVHGAPGQPGPITGFNREGSDNSTGDAPPSASRARGGAGSTAPSSSGLTTPHRPRDTTQPSSDRTPTRSPGSAPEGERQTSTPSTPSTPHRPRESARRTATTSRREGTR